jgi:hypothetical protein
VTHACGPADTRVFLRGLSFVMWMIFCSVDPKKTRHGMNSWLESTKSFRKEIGNRENSFNVELKSKKWKITATSCLSRSTLKE